jgi:hypothetical protein
MYFTGKDKPRLKMKNCKKILQTNGSQKQAAVAIIISGKADFKPKLVKKVKTGTSY